MKKLLNQFRCWWHGHLLEPTGRRGVKISEHRCMRCDRLFIFHADYPNLYGEASDETDHYLTLVTPHVKEAIRDNSRNSRQAGFLNS
jgi:hypothetical protein